MFVHEGRNVGCVCTFSAVYPGPDYRYKGFGVLSTSPHTHSLSPALYSETFCLRSLTPLVVISLQEGEAVYLSRNVMVWEGKDLAPCRTLRGRSREKNNSVLLAFPGCPELPSTADIDKISPRTLVNQATGFYNITDSASHVSI